MARSFRLKRKNRSGETVNDGFRVDLYPIPRDGRPAVSCRFARKVDADDFASHVTQLEGARSAGRRPDRELVAWASRLPKMTRAKLYRVKLLESLDVEQTRPLWVHLLTFARGMIARDCDAKDVKLHTVRRIVRVLRECEIHQVSELDAGTIAEALERSVSGGIKPRTGKRTDASRLLPLSMGAATHNKYVGVLRQFSRWLHRNRRADDDALVGLAKLPDRNVRRQRTDRRAASLDEMTTLIDTATTGPARYGVPGPQRAMIYWLAVETGLRVSEIRSLRVGDFDLGPEGKADACVTIRAAYAKNDKTATLPIVQPDLIARLRTHFDARMRIGPRVKAFDCCSTSNFVRMLRADLKAAGIDYTNDRGRLDFHALRHTAGVWAFEHRGLSPKQVQELMRLSSLALVDRYTRSFRLSDSRVTAGPTLETARSQGAVTG